MTDFVRARRTMVDTQIRPSDVTDTRVLDAFLETPREAFLPGETRALAYLDLDIVVKAGRPPRCLMQPMVLARLLQAAAISARRTASSMSAAQPAIRPRCSLGSAARSWRSNASRIWRDTPAAPSRTAPMSILAEGALEGRPCRRGDPMMSSSCRAP